MLGLCGEKIARTIARSDFAAREKEIEWAGGGRFILREEIMTDKLLRMLAIGVCSLALAGPAFALNPQPEPPGKNQVGATLKPPGPSNAPMATGKTTDCQSGLPSGKRMHGASACRKAGGDPKVHGSNVMLNPQPLPPGAKVQGTAPGGTGTGNPH
jgi:hypothetical protein